MPLLMEIVDFVFDTLYYMEMRSYDYTKQDRDSKIKCVIQYPRLVGHEPRDMIVLFENYS